MFHTVKLLPLNENICTLENNTAYQIIITHNFGILKKNMIWKWKQDIAEKIILLHDYTNSNHYFIICNIIYNFLSEIKEFNTQIILT